MLTVKDRGSLTVTNIINVTVNGNIYIYIYMYMQKGHKMDHMDVAYMVKTLKVDYLGF